MTNNTIMILCDEENLSKFQLENLSRKWEAYEKFIENLDEMVRDLNISTDYSSNEGDIKASSKFSDLYKWRESMASKYEENDESPIPNLLQNSSNPDMASHCVYRNRSGKLIVGKKRGRKYKGIIEKRVVNTQNIYEKPYLSLKCDRNTDLHDKIAPDLTNSSDNIGIKSETVYNTRKRHFSVEHLKYPDEDTYSTKHSMHIKKRRGRPKKFIFDNYNVSKNITYMPETSFLNTSKSEFFDNVQNINEVNITNNNIKQVSLSSLNNKDIQEFKQEAVSDNDKIEILYANFKLKYEENVKVSKIKNKPFVNDNNESDPNKEQIPDILIPDNDDQKLNIIAPNILTHISSIESKLTDNITNYPPPTYASSNDDHDPNMEADIFIKVKGNKGKKDTKSQCTLISSTESNVFEIVRTATQRGRPMFIDNMGFTYNIKRVKPDEIIWRCSVRNKYIECSAIILQQKSDVSIPFNDEFFHPEMSSDLSQASPFSLVDHYIKAFPHLFKIDSTDVWYKGPIKHIHSPLKRVVIEKIKLTAQIKDMARQNYYEHPSLILDSMISPNIDSYDINPTNSTVDFDFINSDHIETKAITGCSITDDNSFIAHDNSSNLILQNPCSSLSPRLPYTQSLLVNAQRKELVKVMVRARHKEFYREREKARELTSKRQNAPLTSGISRGIKSTNMLNITQTHENPFFDDSENLGYYSSTKQDESNVLHYEKKENIYFK
ncbi:unnamed protein product [Gordionus sp. m RMFG-2023]|uniref:uncharacterized protein LOC135931331 isoform X2 n=1 Tax=Gordionus sp. m RMFG-2023 TaxID=3053472 RepID=UPI0030E433F0